MNHFAYTVETFNGKILGVWFNEPEAINYLERFPSNNTFINYLSEDAYKVLKATNAI